MKRQTLNPAIKYLLIHLILMAQLNSALGQLKLDEEPKRLYYDRLAPVKKFKDMRDFRDVFHVDKYLLGKRRISGNISYVTGRVAPQDSLGEFHDEYRQAIAFFTRIRFFEHFSFNTTFYADFNKNAKARWTSDYTYTIGRYNWKPKTFSYGYENYLNNRYTDPIEEVGQKFLEGYYFFSFNHELPRLTQKIKLDSTTNFKFTYFVRYAPRYRDSMQVIHGEGLGSGKPIVGASLRATLFWNIYVEGAVYYYFDPPYEKQQPWDPDFTYGFGYFDWRSFRLTLTYGNWAINRFPWKTQSYPNYGFLDGEFKFGVNWIW